jgi:hypothetical protein
LPITGGLFVLYVATYMVSVMRRRDDDIEIWIMAQKVVQMFLFFNILYLCNCG